MSGFAIRNPYLIVVICLFIAVVGVTTPDQHAGGYVPGDEHSRGGGRHVLFRDAARADRDRYHQPLRALLHPGQRHRPYRIPISPGVSIIKVYFQPGSNADSAVTNISNLAMAQLRRLPPGTLPPVVLKFDASSLPVCLVTFKGEGLDETALRDLAQFQVRNQIGGSPGASVPQPFGGKYRQIMVYADPYKLEAHQLSLMDVVRSVNNANLILPAGDVQLGQLDYNIYTNSQLPTVQEIDQLPIKTVGQSPVRVADIGYAEDAQQIQTNIVRIDGQRSVYTPVMKQGGDTNTIAVVEGIREALRHLVDVPRNWSRRWCSINRCS
jgi:HAE1 family hydrophobic/amphiphilic exporter-1